MLVNNQFITIKINKATENWYKNKGYDISKKTIVVAAEDLSPGSKYRVKVECDYCGDIVEVIWKDYYIRRNEQYACKHCRGKKTSENTLVIRQEDLYNRALSVCNDNGYKLITKKEEIMTAETRVQYECPKHGICETKIYTLILGHGCIKCSYEWDNRVINTPEKIDAVAKENGYNIINPQDYKGWDIVNLNCICKLCNNIYPVSYHSIRRKCCMYCPECSSLKSAGEREITDYLEHNHINFIPQKTFENCRNKLPLHFDFYLPEYNMCIEYQGKQHYESIDHFGGEKGFEDRKRNDLIKKSYCETNNIDLLYITYLEFDNIKNILNEKLSLHEDIV